MAAPSLENTETATPQLRQNQILVVALLTVGYAGYYLCRAHLSVSTPLLLQEFKGVIDKSKLGGMISLATLFYAFGKFVNGSLADFLGGRRMFLLGMGGAVLCSLLFGLAGGLPLFTLAWVLNRALQSCGWVGMVKITSRWFSYAVYGTAMGFISLSYLFGDFFSRLFLGTLIAHGMGWRGVFFTSAGVLGAIFLVTLAFLKEGPRDVGLAEPRTNPSNVFGAEGEVERPEGLWRLLAPLLSNPVFWIVCLLSLGFTLVRETFQDWTPTYLHEVIGMESGRAGQVSSLFPLFGGFSVLLVGILSDKLGRIGRAALILVGLLLSIPALLFLAYVKLGDATMAMVLLGAVAFVMLGPYSFLAGAVALDFGGKRGSATACGWIDGIGYLGGVFAGKGIGAIAEKQGWSAAFLTLTVVAAATTLAAAFYLIHQIKMRSDGSDLSSDLK